jgi:hypothetical protein
MNFVKFHTIGFADKKDEMVRLLRMAMTILFIVVLAGCSTTAKTSPSTTSPSTIASTAGQEATPVAGTPLPPYNPAINAVDFSAQVTNPLFPLTPGTIFIYEGNRDGVPQHNEVTVTTETKVIMGVACVVVRDVVTSNNAIVEKTTDWYAQDKAGNVWYFGEDTAEYENGAVTTTAGTWMAGVDGALPGIVMKASPMVGDAYRQEYRPGEAEDFAKILQLDGSWTVPAGNFTNVLVSEDTDLLDATKLEHKYYAAGVGYLGSNGIVNGHKEEIKLSSISKK